MWTRTFGVVLAVIGTVVTLVAGGCGGPKYPTCDSDEQCNADGHKGVCADHKCVDCRDDAACGAGRSCKAGRCEARQETKTTVPVAAAVECGDDNPCKGPGEKCQNGHCVAPDPGGPGCRDFAAPKFGFEQTGLDGEAKETLQRLAGCLTKGSLSGRKVLLTGHCDNRGEYEFNMSLGAERAEVVRAFLAGLGVSADRVATSSRGKLDAAGQDESGWARDRRVDVEVR